MRNFIIVCTLAFASSVFAWTVDSVPNPTRHGAYLSNPDHVISSSDAAEISKRLSNIEKQTSNEVAVVVLKTIGSEVPKNFATALFNKWGVGKKGNDNGVLVLAVIDQRRFEIEVGYGLEGTLTDIRCGQIIRNNMIPVIRRGGAGPSLLAGLDQIEATLTGTVPENATDETSTTVE